MYTLIHPKDSKNPTDDPNPETSNLLPPDPEPTISELPIPSAPPAPPVTSPHTTPTPNPSPEQDTALNTDLDDSYLCPLSMDYMMEPVQASDGTIYDRNSIIKWYRLHGTSPFTRQTLTEPNESSFTILPELQAKIRQYLTDRQIPFPEIETLPPHSLSPPSHPMDTNRPRIRCIRCHQLNILHSTLQYPIQQCPCGQILSSFPQFQSFPQYSSVSSVTIATPIQTSHITIY